MPRNKPFVHWLHEKAPRHAVSGATGIPITQIIDELYYSIVLEARPQVVQMKDGSSGQRRVAVDAARSLLKLRY